MHSPTRLDSYRENWQDEVDSAAQYRVLSGLTTDGKVARVFADLARTEESHVAFWESKIREAGGEVRERKPSWRSRVLIFVAKRLGGHAILSTIAANESALEERWHATVIREIMKGEPSGEQAPFVGRLEGRHRAVGGNALRAAVLGANDGLCSNLSLVMGAVGAASGGGQVVLVTGLAGLLAGAFSMALGEWISVTSSRELAEREIRIEGHELAEDPEGEGKELQLIYEAKGVPAKEAKRMARTLLKDQTTALETLSREELGIDPKELGGSAWVAAVTSFLLFAMGAVIPVAPFLFLDGKSAVVTSLVSSSGALFLVGAAITVFTGRSAWRAGARQLVLGLTAALVTFGLGRLLGVTLGG